MNVLYTIMVWVIAYLAIGILAVALRKAAERAEGITPEFAKWYWDFKRHYTAKPWKWYHEGYKDVIAPEPRPDLENRRYESLRPQYGTSILSTLWPFILIAVVVEHGILRFLKNMYTEYPERIAEAIGKALK